MEKGCTSRMRFDGSRAIVLEVPVALRVCTVLVADPLSVRAVPVLPSALDVVVAPVDFTGAAATGAGVGLPPPSAAGSERSTPIAAIGSPPVAAAKVGAATDVCKTGTAAATLAPGATGTAWVVCATGATGMACATGAAGDEGIEWAA